MLSRFYLKRRAAKLMERRHVGGGDCGRDGRWCGCGVRQWILGVRTEWEDWIKGRELLECIGEELMGGMVVSCEKWW